LFSHRRKVVVAACCREVSSAVVRPLVRSGLSNARVTTTAGKSSRPQRPRRRGSSAADAMSPYDSRHQRHTDSGSASKQDCIVGDSEDSDCVATAMAKMSMKHHHNDDDLDQEGDKSGDGGWSFDTPEDKAQLKAQRAQLWSWLKSVGANIFQEGINLTKISLPVCLFEARSFLERITTNWDYLDFLVEAANADDPVTRMKWVVAFAIGGLSRQVSFHKPFNPILGETFQAKYPNGVEVFCEQISHHPPVSSWQVIDPDGKFMFYGNGNWVAGIKGNAVKGRQTGINCVQFADGSKISYELPGILVKGVLWGHRCIKVCACFHALK